MVSFQCHACGDVVKKPRLDTHRGRCHSGFDCIDCHTTFSGPAEYKGHTSCITEAEKYQKSLYKGPKTEQNVSAPRNNYPNSAVSTTYNPEGRQGGYGAQRSGWGRPQFQRNNATGANDTPLGTPSRVTPVPTHSPAVPTNLSHAETNGAERKEGGAKDIMEKRKNKRDKKRKSTLSTSESIDGPHTNGDEPPNKRLKVDPVSIPLPLSSPVKVDEQRKIKKSKKAKMEKALEGGKESERLEENEKRTSIGVAEIVEGAVNIPETSSKDGEVDAVEAREQVDQPKKRKRDETADVATDAPAKKKKKKKSKKDTDSTAVDVSHEKLQDREKKKKKKKSGTKEKSTATMNLDISSKETKPKKEDKYEREKEKRKRKAKSAVNILS